MDNEQQKLFQTVEHIMKSPELVGIINELRGSGDPSGDNAVSQTEILSHLPEVTAMLRPLLGDTSADTAASTAEEVQDVQEVQDVRPVSAAPSPKKYDKARAEKLMSALKPYLSKNRCDMIDKCVSVIQLTDVVEALQGLEGLTKQSRPKP